MYIYMAVVFTENLQIRALSEFFLIEAMILLTLGRGSDMVSNNNTLAPNDSSSCPSIIGNYS